MSTHIKRESAAFLIALGVVGILLTVIGAFIGEKNIFLMNTLASLGAAILGAAFSLLMSRIFEPSQMDEITRLISILQKAPLITDDQKVRPRRLLYHGYLFSHAAGIPKWKYRVFDFTKDRTPGHLHAKVKVWVPSEAAKYKHHPERLPKDSKTRNGQEGGHQIYIYDGYLCDPYHLMLVGRLDPEFGTEPDVVHVFPFALSKTQGDIMSGLAFLESSDNKRIVTPSILSKVPLTDETEFGPVNNPEDEARLMAIWQNSFHDTTVRFNF